MNKDQPNKRPPMPRLWLRKTEQVAAAVILAVALLAIAGHWIYQGRYRGRLIEIDRAEQIAIDFKIDINQADWPELCLMPGIGEQLAKRIVEYRTENGAFRDLQDLRKVRGIGPKTWEGMQPYLVPLPDIETTAEGKSGSGLGNPIN